MNMPTETFLTTLYTLDHIIHHRGRLVSTTRPAPAGRQSGQETSVLGQRSDDTLSGTALARPLAQHWLGMDEERGFLRYVRNNFLALFPRLIDQSQFNRRARASSTDGPEPVQPTGQSQFNRRVRSLCWLINRMRQHLVEKMGLADAPCQLIDGTPVQVRHWRRFGKGHLLLPEAALGYCAAKKETFYGFRLLAVTTLDGIIIERHHHRTASSSNGIIIDWDLFAANVDEREAAQDLLEHCRDLSVLGDKVG